MTKERAWPVRAMYILIAAALAMGLFIMAAPAQKVSANPDLSEWSRVETPTTDGWVLAPNSTIIDYALASAGKVAYAVVYSDSEACLDDTDGDNNDYYGGYYLLKSDDYAATWDDISDAVADEVRDILDLDKDAEVSFTLLQVATDWVDEDFVAVALDLEPLVGDVHVFFSTDGGDTFKDIGRVEDAGVTFDESSPQHGITDLVVSPEASGKREIAIGGRDNYDHAVIFRSTVTGTSAGDWEDTTTYGGWDDENDGSPLLSISIADLIFSPSWATDKTILAVTVVSGTIVNHLSVYLQCGSWGATGAWNAKSTLGIAAVPIVQNADLATGMFVGYDRRGVAGLTLPSDYNSKNTDTRMLWAWVNYAYNTTNPGGPASQIFLVDNDDATPLGPLGQIRDGKVWLANISYKGTIAEGEALAGLIGDEDGVPTATCCKGVQVYHNSGIHNMFICCQPWKKACKPPTGATAMAVSYVGEDKAYAIALQGVMDYDEGAWSVTFDDGDTWNQLSLIDTDIDYFSDVAVSPDCNKEMLVSVHKYNISYNQCDGCDSVWLHANTLPEAEEYSGKWLRTWSGQLQGHGDGEYAQGILRLPPEETTGDTVFLVDLGTGNVYENDMETLACWDSIGSSELDDIADLAPLDKDTLYAVDYNDGQVGEFDNGEWQTPVDSKLDEGFTIAVWGGNATYVLVGGFDGDVSYSKDGGETFTKLEDVAGDGAYVTVAFDTYFNTNKTIYAAVAYADTESENGIYRWVIGATEEEWKDLGAEPLESQLGLPLDTFGGNTTDDSVEVDFTGIVVDRPGNPFTSADNGGVIYASYEVKVGQEWQTGAARSLEREVTVCTTCLAWDFLRQGLGEADTWEDFYAYPDALKICGCLTPDSNTRIWAIDWGAEYNGYDYDNCDNDFGSVWTFEDCYAKKAPEPTTPTVEADPCSCYAAPFTLKWSTLCDACVYEIQFALDDEFTMPVKVNGEGEAATDYIITGITGDTPAYSILGGAGGGLSCETTYYWRVRASKAATDQVIHSWWSVPDTFTVPPSVQAGIITLVAPVPGALNQPTKSVGFSWDLQADANAFTWVLSKNADLSSPLDSKNVTSKATTHANTLDHGTTYYWQVKAYNDGALIGVSPIGTFTTGATGAFCDPIDGLCFDTQAELTAHEATAHPAPGTPFWVWVVIAIGAVLVIVVIVLIFRTRRV
jgi:hypothetical protein